MLLGPNDRTANFNVNWKNITETSSFQKPAPEQLASISYAVDIKYETLDGKPATNKDHDLLLGTVAL